MPIRSAFRVVSLCVVSGAIFCACSAHVSGPPGPVRTALPTASASGADVLQTQTATVSAAGGATLETLNASASFPGGVFTTDTAVTLRLLARTSVSLPNAALSAVGPALSVAIGSAGTKSAIRGARASAATSGANVALKFSLPRGYQSIDLSRVIPEVALTGKDGKIYDFAFDGKINADGSITIDVPVNLVQQAAEIVLYLQSSTATTPPEARYLTLGPLNNPATWSPGILVQPNKKTLVFLHGVLSSIESAYPCASSIVQQGGYDQAVGLSYDWSYPPTAIAPYVATLIGSLGQQQRIDIEAHSYGVLNAVAALPLTQAKIQNVILLGGPLEGSPLGPAADLENLGNSIPQGAVPATIDQLNRVSSSGISAYVKPGSLLLAQLEARAYALNPPGRTIKVAGNQLLPYERSSLIALYFIDIAAVNGDTPDGIDQLLGGSDGLVTIGSALSPRIPTPYAEVFPLNHTQLECDPAIEAYVAAHLLVTPSPSPSPSPTPPPTPTPTPSAALTYVSVQPMAISAIGKTSGGTSGNLGTVLVKWAPAQDYIVITSALNSGDHTGTCSDHHGTYNGGFQIHPSIQYTAINDPPFTAQQVLPVTYFALDGEASFTCTVFVYVSDASQIPILSQPVTVTFTYTAGPYQGT